MQDDFDEPAVHANVSDHGGFRNPSVGLIRVSLLLGGVHASAVTRPKSDKPFGESPRKIILPWASRPSYTVSRSSCLPVSSLMRVILTASFPPFWFTHDVGMVNVTFAGPVVRLTFCTLKV